MPKPSERQLREELLRFGRLCYERHLLVAFDGNLSVRLSPELVLCTQAGCHKGMLADGQLVVIDMAGRVVRGSGQPTSEMAMHLACYRARPDVAAVIHAHPPICVAFTIAGVTLARCVLPEVVLTLGTVPTLPYDTTGSPELAAGVGRAMANHDAVMLDRHGAVCVGTSLLEAFCRLETMEHMAEIMKCAHELGAIQDLPCEEAVRLRAMGLKRYGGPPPAVAKADEPGADLPPVCLTCAGCEAGLAAEPVPPAAVVESNGEPATLAEHVSSSGAGASSAPSAPAAPAAPAADPLDAEVRSAIERVLSRRS